MYTIYKCPNVVEDHWKITLLAVCTADTPSERHLQELERIQGNN
jgi:hypothetical protein